MIQFNTMVSSTIKSILIFVVLFISTINFSQNLTEQQLNHILETSTEPELVRLNTELIINKNYYHASIVADKLLTFNQESPNYNYRKGFSIFTKLPFSMKPTPNSKLQSLTLIRINTCYFKKNFQRLFMH